MHIGEVLKEIRKKRGMTQVEVCNKLGFTQAYLSLVESGEKENPSNEFLSKIGSLYNVPPQVIVFMTISEKDIPKENKKVFNKLKPLINKVIAEFV